MNLVDLCELKILCYNEILILNYFFYFWFLCVIFSIFELFVWMKKVINLLFVFRSNKKNCFVWIELSWFLIWWFFLLLIFEICIFFFFILSFGFWLLVIFSFVGGFLVSFKLILFDWGVVCCRFVKWIDLNNKVSLLNYK